jgi:4-amino-4-deoxy-L-arabinose transferase-like glycosyltransferase
MTALLEQEVRASGDGPGPGRQAVRWELIALVLLAGALELVNLGVNGYANEYYSAAVRSMSSSWHAFLFNSFDPHGVMTVDKPPLALWVQALSVRVFGFHPVAMLVPQALMTVGSVALVYDLVRRRFGRIGGFAGGLVLALTPISVAMGRHNNPDAALILCCVAALWFLVRALEDGRTRWMVWCGVMVGLAFETKMLAAFLVIPGFVAALRWVAPRGRAAAARSLAAGGAALAVVGGAWPVLMWLTPAADRPWISGTKDNSIWSLIFGYNGLGRLDGQAGGPGGAAGGGRFGGGGGGGPFGGSAGVFRLLHQSLGGQAGWFLGFALVAAVALVVVSRLRRADARTGWVIAVGGAFACCAVAFSFAKGIFHPYYVSQLAPFTAALVGAGVALALRSRWIGPAAIVAGVIAELVVIHQDATDVKWAIALVLVVGAAAAAALVLLSDRRWRLAAVGAALAALLAAPASWAVQTVGHATGTTFPAGGPQGSGFGGGGPGGFRRGGFRRGGFPGRGGFRPPAGGRFTPPVGGGGFTPPAGGRFTPPAGGGGFTPPAGGFGGARSGGGGGPLGGNASSLNAVVKYAKAHGGGTIGVSSQSGASASVIAGADVAGIGGFSGRESQVSAGWLAAAVRDGRLRWIVADAQGGAFGGGGMPNDSRVGARDALALVEQTCRKLTVGGTTVYDCQGKASALLAAAK